MRSWEDGIAQLKRLEQAGMAPDVARLSDLAETTVNLRMGAPKPVQLLARGRCLLVLGWEGSALLGRAFPDLVDPSDRARWETAARVPPGSTSRTELTLRGRGGQGLPVLVSVTGLELDAVLVRTVVVSDLSELVAVRSELQEAQRGAGLGSWRWDTGTGLVDWSREMFALYELPVRDGPLELREAIALRAHPDDDTSIIGPCGVWHQRYDVRCGIIMVTRGEGGGNAAGTETATPVPFITAGGRRVRAGGKN